MTTTHVVTGRSVPLSSLWLEHQNWTNPREFTGLDTSEIAELSESIKTKGIIDPLKVQMIRVNGEVVNLVIDGQRRYLAGKEVLAKNALIPVVDLSEEVIEELTPEVVDNLLIKALTTLEREDLSTYELMTVAKRMKERGKTLAYIGKAINKSEGTVSKFLTAIGTATPKLMLRWRKGEITDEQFKELAAVKDPEAQAKATKEVVDARKSGDKAEARVIAKEVKEAAARKPTNGHDGTQLGSARPALTPADGGAPDKKPAGPKPPSRVVLDEFLAMADKRPPTADYVKGLFDGVRYALGLVEPDAFSKAWSQYVARIDGKKPAKKAKAKPAKKAGKPTGKLHRQAKTAKRIERATKKAAKKKAKR